MLYGGRKAWPAKQEVLVSIKCQSKAHRTDSLCYRVVSKQWCQMKDLSQTLLSFLLHARDLHRKVASQRQQQIFFFIITIFEYLSFSIQISISNAKCAGSSWCPLTPQGTEILQNLKNPCQSSEDGF